MQHYDFRLRAVLAAVFDTIERSNDNLTLYIDDSTQNDDILLQNITNKLKLIDLDLIEKKLENQKANINLVKKSVYSIVQPMLTKTVGFLIKLIEEISTVF